MATAKRRVSGPTKETAKSSANVATRARRTSSPKAATARRGSAAGGRRGSAESKSSLPRPMRPSISFISLLVRDVAAARRFYESLGLVASERSREDFALFQMNGVVLAIATRASVAKELGVTLGRGSGVLLSHNVESEEAVGATLEMARRAGAKVLRKASPASWGGLIGCFADPDGHVWEVVFNPQLPMDAAGNALLDPPDVW